MNTQTTRPTVRPLAAVTLVLAGIGAGLLIGAFVPHGTPEPTPTVTVTPEPAEVDICADAAAELEANGQRMVAEVVVPLMFEDADPTSAEMRDALAAVMADYEATYWDAQQVCKGQDPVEFEQ